jgi:hypothetical protein
MHHHVLRLSRLRAPRGTPGAALLVAIVFVAFGLLISALGIADAGSAAPRYLDGSATNLANWLLGLW